MKVLFIDTVHPILWQQLTENGYTCIDATEWNQENILSQIEQYQGVVIRSKYTIDKAFLDIASSLRFIARSGAGLENIDVEYAYSKGVKVFNSPEGNRDAVGEQAIGMLLSLFNNLNRADQEVRKGLWRREENRGHEIKGKTIGIIGYGNMGKAFAQRLSGFECTVLAYDKYQNNYSDKYATEASLQKLFKQADVISFHTPLTEETKFMANSYFFNQFEKPIYLINTARGKVVKTEDLVLAIQSGKIKGACLDVLEFENSSFELLDRENNISQTLQFLNHSDKVILSPHIAGWTFESYQKLSGSLATKVLNAFGRCDK